MLKSCSFCGNLFSPNNHSQIFCSVQCRNSSYQRKYYQDHYGADNPPDKRKCAFCGKDFIPRNSKQRFCSKKCWHNEDAQKPRPAQKISSLDELARQARECNLDYGTYRAFIAMGKTFEQLKATADYRSTAAHAKHARTRHN